MGSETSKEFLFSPTLNPQISLILGWKFMIKSYAPSKQMLKNLKKQQKPTLMGITSGAHWKRPKLEQFEQ